MARSRSGIALTGLVLLLLSTVASRGLEPSGLLEIHCMNVRYGASALVIGPNGTKVLMDAGDTYRGADVVDYFQDPRLDLQPAEGLDYTLVSHLHADHIGGFDEIVGNTPDRYNVPAWPAGRNYYNGGDVPTKPTSQAYLQYISATQSTLAGDPVKIEVGEQVIDLGDGAYMAVVAVDGHLIDGVDVPGVSHQNDRSVAVVIHYGDFEFIWAGDLGGDFDDFDCTGRTLSSSQIDVESDLVTAICTGTDPLIGDTGVDVMHVSHHGSNTSTSSVWMNAMKPEVAIISVGDGNGHPTVPVVENVLGSQVDCVTAPAALVLQTDEGDTDHGASTAGHVVGDIVVLTDGTYYGVHATGETHAGIDERADAHLPGYYLVDELGPECPMLTTLTGPLWIDDAFIWQAKHTIDTAGEVEVASGGEVVLRAGSAVTLDNGFGVWTGGVLRLELEPFVDCTSPYLSVAERQAMLESYAWN